MNKIFLLKLLLLSFLVSGCGQQEAPKEPPKSMFERIQSGEILGAQEPALSFLKEVCMAMSTTPKIDTAARRGILKDYGFDLASIARIEQNIDTIFATVDGCPYVISHFFSERESSGE